jgi:hypothetical protein
MLKRLQVLVGQPEPLPLSDEAGHLTETRITGCTGILRKKADAAHLI